MSTSMKESWLLHFNLLFLMSFPLQISAESYTIFPGQTLSGNSTLTSEDGIFELGFFAPGNSQNYYIGIWYKMLPMPEKTVVWVANRDLPVSDPYSSSFELRQDCNFVLKNPAGLTVWSTNVNFCTDDPVGVLSNTGYLMIKWGLDSLETLWHSFDYPTDTWLPGAWLGIREYNGTQARLKSWTDQNNPAPGFFSLEYDYANKMLLRNGPMRYYINPYSHFGCHLIEMYNPDGCYQCIAYSIVPNSSLVRYVVDVTGQIKQFVWSKGFQDWKLVSSQDYGAPSSFLSLSSLSSVSSSPSPSPSPSLPPCWDIEENGKRKTTRIAVEVTIVLLSLCTITLMLKFMWRKAATTSSQVIGHTMVHFKYRDLQKATKNFKQKLGEGGFGTVYKGELSNSTLIAVKEIRGLMRGEKQFRAELSTIGVIQHKNLVRLLGFCSKDSKRFLVFEYMPKGSLESHLFSNGFDILDWKTRYNIALGIAKGLAYLHEECRDCIIHCDIKPENILLDAESNPKVTDFGLAKLLCRDFSRVLTTMRGTRGYLAPEWFSGEHVTSKIDVYSYGQMLFEIISGQRNMDLLNNELSNYFPGLVLNALNNGAEILTLVDSKLEGKINVEEVIRACKIAGWCIQDNEIDRPTMMQVVQILEGTIEVTVPPIPSFFLSLAKGSVKASDIKGSEAYCTSNSPSTSFTFQTPEQLFNHMQIH